MVRTTLRTKQLRLTANNYRKPSALEIQFHLIVVSEIKLQAIFARFLHLSKHRMKSTKSFPWF